MEHNLNYYEFQTIGQFVSEANRRRAVWRRLCLALSLVIGFGTSVGAHMEWDHFHSAKNPKAKNPTTATPGGTIYIGRNLMQFSYGQDMFPPKPVNDEDLSRALDEAVAAWSRSMGHAVRKPPMVRGHCGLQDPSDVVACVSRGIYAIQIANKAWPVDWKTILMHEIGHLLGVPHIEGDDLMDAVYRWNPGGPTDDAVAIARSKEAHADDPRTVLELVP